MQVLNLSDRVTLRVDPEQMQEWKARADKERRSLSNWIVWMVEKCREQEDANNN